ncbi:MAG: VWA domain-containing protein [Deltaproteobacteria bacterium]|nr:VWA domain-containing protein [Deltaproteobacteria bacterium]
MSYDRASESLRRGCGCVLFFFVVIFSPAFSGTALAALTIQEGDAVLVDKEVWGGESFRITVDVGYTNGHDWRGTKVRAVRTSDDSIVGPICENTTDFTGSGSGTYTLTEWRVMGFDGSPGLPAGEYHIEVRARELDDCSGRRSDWVRAKKANGNPATLTVKPLKIKDVDIRTPQAWAGIPSAIFVKVKCSENPDANPDARNWYATDVDPVPTAGGDQENICINHDNFKVDPPYKGIFALDALPVGEYRLDIIARGKNKCGSGKWDSVSVLTEDTLTISEIPENLDLIPACGLRVILVLDESKSMKNRIGQIRSAFMSILTALANTGARVAVVDFGQAASRPIEYTEVTSPGTLEGLFTDYIDANNGDPVYDYDPTQNPPKVGTNFEDAFREAAAVNSVEVADLVVLITDARPTCYNNADGGVTRARGNAGLKAQALVEGVAAANTVKGQGTHIFAVGILNNDNLAPESEDELEYGEDDGVVAGDDNALVPLDELVSNGSGPGKEETLIALSGPDAYPGADFTAADYTTAALPEPFEDLRNAAEPLPPDCQIQAQAGARGGTEIEAWVEEAGPGAVYEWVAEGATITSQHPYGNMISIALPEDDGVVKLNVRVTETNRCECVYDASAVSDQGALLGSLRINVYPIPAVDRWGFAILLILMTVAGAWWVGRN